MALDVVIMDGDTVSFSPIPGVNIVMKPGKMKASGKTTINGKKVCVEGDEKNVVVSCPYNVPPFVNGSGNLTIDKLAANQLSVKSKSGNKSVILKGTAFTSRFQATVKAMNPANGTTDPGVYSGQGQFISSNEKIKAT